MYAFLNLLGAIYGTIRAVYQAHQHMEYDVALQLGRDLLNIGLSLFAIYLSAGLIIIVAISVFATALQLTVAWPLVLRLKVPLFVRPRLTEMRRILILALPFSAIVLIMVAGGQMTTIILSVTAKQADVGLYGAAQTIYSILLIFPSMFSTAVFPVFSRLSVESSNKLSMAFRKSFELLLIVGFPMAALGILLAAPMVKLIFGSSFDGAVPVLQLLVLALAGMTGFACGTYLSSTERQTFYALSQGAFVIIEIVLSLILIPRFGMIGAAASFLIYALLGFVFYTLACYHFVSLPLPWALFVKVLLATTIVTLCTRFLLRFSLHFILAGLLAVFFYGLLLLLFRVTSIHEWGNVWRAFFISEHQGSSVRVQGE